MQKILIVDDDEAVRGLHRLRLSDSYDVIETGDAEEALALALHHKPAAVLLDPMMPKFSGFEVCQSLHSLSYTSLIPIFVIPVSSATSINSPGMTILSERCQRERASNPTIRAFSSETIGW